MQTTTPAAQGLLTLGWTRSLFADELGECTAPQGCARLARWQHYAIPGVYCTQHAQMCGQARS